MDKRLIVLTTKNLQIPEKLERFTTTSSTFVPEKLISELSDQHVDHIYIDGGLVIQEFLSAGLVDEITVTIVPIIIGRGKSFSKLVSKDLHLNHLKTTVYEFGFIQNKYRITKLIKG